MQSLIRVALLIPFLGIALSACPKSVDIPLVSIRPVENSVLLRRTAQGLAFDFGAVIANAGPGTIFVAECSPQLQRKLDGGWVTVWSPVCITSGMPQQISAGDSASVRVRGSAFSDPGSQPQLDPRFASGTYRFFWNISYSVGLTGPTRVLPSERSLSDEFGVTIAQ